MRRTRGAFVPSTFVVAAILMLVCACTSRTDNGQASGNASNSATGVARAAQAIAPFEKSPSDLGISDPLSRPPTGKVIDLLAGSFPIWQSIAKAATVAAQKLGARLNVINAGATPQELLRAWDQVLQSPPDAVIVGNNQPTALYQSQLQAMHQKGIPVMTLFTNDDPLAFTIYSHAQYAQVGSLEADYVIAKSAGEVHALILYEPQAKGLQEIVTAMEETLKRDCPSCEYGVVETQFSDIGKTDPGRVVSYIQAHPNTNWIILPDSGDVIGVPEALDQAGLNKAQILTGGGDKVNYSYMKAGRQTADLSQSPEFLGWALIDGVARALAGQESKAFFEPTQFLTAKDLTWDINQPWPSLSGYQDKFEQLWGTH